MAAVTRAAVERVSFARPVAPKPRLSPVYVPGRRSARFWTAAELDVLRRHFESKGPQFCRGLLQGRSTNAIYQTAGKLGLSRAASGGRARIADPAAFDERIRQAWANLNAGRKGEVSRLADQLGVPRSWLSRRALQLGLTLPRMTKEPPWGAAELALLKRVPLHDPHRAAQIFRAHGFQRTPAAIMVKCKRAGLSRRYRETLSATACAKVLGVDIKTITAWLAKGLLAASKRKTRRLPQQGGDPWSVTRAEFRLFIRDNAERLDRRKVDLPALVEIVAGGASAA